MRLKDAIDQKLMLRGSRDFESREEYEEFLRETVSFTIRISSMRSES